MILLALVVSCAGPDPAADDTAVPTEISGASTWPYVPPCEEGTACCNPHVPSLTLCVSGSDNSWSGAFVDEGRGEFSFLTTDGEVLNVTMSAAEGAVPAFDLVAAGPVVVTQVGGCGWGIEAAVRVADSTGTTLLITSTIPVEDLAGWTVDPLESDTFCEGRSDSGCFQWMHDRPVRFTRAGETIELMQGQEAVLDGHRVGVNVSQSASGKRGCSDVSSESTVWWVTGP
jgi:hypothetical protein